MNIFFTADTHFNHKNIVRGTSEWGDVHGQQVRNFDTLEEHNQVLGNNINSVVKENDILYHLGDWSFGGAESIIEFMNQLQCKNIHLILGNHDHHIANPNKPYKKLFTSVNQYLVKKINGQHMFLCHYAMRTWDKAAHGVWMLYGHSHGSLSEYIQLAGPYGRDVYISTEEKYKTMDVGIDTHPEFRPYHFDEISLIMKDRIDMEGIDHHSKQTN